MMISDRPDKEPLWAVLIPNKAGDTLALAERYFGPDYPKDEWQVIRGSGKYSAVVAYPGVEDPTGCEDMAKHLAKELGTPAYSLELHNIDEYEDYEPVRTFRPSGEVEYSDEDPTTFANERGVNLLWYTPQPSETAWHACVVANATCDEIRSVYDGDDIEYTATTAGVLCTGSNLAYVVASYIARFPGPVYDVLFRPGDDLFRVTINRGFDDEEEYLSNRVGERMTPLNSPAADNVLGETLPEKILERLHIPPHVLSLDMKPKYTLS